MPGLENIDDNTLMEAARFHGLDAPAAERTFGEIVSTIRAQNQVPGGRVGGFDGVSDATLQEAAAFHGIETKPFGTRVKDAFG